MLSKEEKGRTAKGKGGEGTTQTSHSLIPLFFCCFVRRYTRGRLFMPRGRSVQVCVRQSCSRVVVVLPVLYSCAVLLSLKWPLPGFLPATDGIHLSSIEFVSKDLVLCQVLIPEDWGSQCDDGKGMDCRHHMNYQVINNKGFRARVSVGCLSYRCKGFLPKGSKA